MLLRYLRTIPGVHVELAAVDCMDEESTRALFSQIKCAGVFFVSVA